jgi:hypothetical protein
MFHNVEMHDYDDFNKPNRGDMFITDMYSMLTKKKATWY